MATEPLPALDCDAFCPSCGYNVRGLSGDPIRCPECGSRSARNELRWPKQRGLTRLERCRRNLKASADLCALATLPGLLALWVLFTGDCLHFAPLRIEIEIGSTNVRALAVTSAAIWLIGCTLFAIQCWGLRGWVRALAIYHLTAAPAMLVSFVLVVVLWIAICWLCGDALQPLSAKLERATRGTPLANADTAILIAATMLPPAWLAVRCDPLSIGKRIGANRLAALTQMVTERTPS